jgi:hypothetical protein
VEKLEARVWPLIDTYSTTLPAAASKSVLATCDMIIRPKMSLREGVGGDLDGDGGGVQRARGGAIVFDDDLAHAGRGVAGAVTLGGGWMSGIVSGELRLG